MATSSEDMAQATVNDVPRTDGATAVMVHYDANGPSPNAELPEVGVQQSFDTKPSKGKVEVNLDKLLSRIRSESMYELRKLRHQHRPVSEFSRKQQLEELLNSRRLRAPLPGGNHATGNSATPTPHCEREAEAGNIAERARQFASQPAATEPQGLMPEGVRLEVRGVFERRRVSDVLQGPLMNEMERVLREGLERHRRRQQRRPRPRPRVQHAHGQGPRASLLDAIRNGRPARGHAQQSGSSNSHRRVRFAPPENGQYPMPRRDQSRIIERVRQSPALNSLGPETRDRIVAEIGHLVQQQLVTSALSGEFRGVLELHIQERAERISQGQDPLQSLERRSAHSASYAGARNYDPEEPSQSSIVELREEVTEMKSQLQELKQMMRVSFDLQLDIQRAIRQEVAAALAAFCTPQGVAGPIPIPVPVDGGHRDRGMQQDFASNAHVIESGNCVICSEASIDSVIYRCGHMCVCVACGLEMKAQGLKCPICRAPITDIVRAYASMI